MAASEGNEGRVSIYRVSRSIKKRDNSLYNALRSIYEDSIFVGEIAGLWPGLPLVANLRCGLWYSTRFGATCYFKSTDGHTNNWSFSTSRLNLHLAELAGQRGGCIIVDSTRRGKRFPDSMSKTIPIWACIINRAIKNYWQRVIVECQKDGVLEPNISFNEAADMRRKFVDWDCDLHLPVWVPNTEKAAIEEHLEEWTRLLESCGADIGFVASNLRKPLRPLWISQKTVIWLNEVPDYDSWDFTPLILISASASDGNHGAAQFRATTEFSWHYIPGAGDDEESWARGLSANQFWKHAFDLIDGGPDLCNKRVAEIVENERVYHAQRGNFHPQITLKPLKLLEIDVSIHGEPDTSFLFNNSEILIKSLNITSSVDQSLVNNTSSVDQSLFWLGSTNLALSAVSHVPNAFEDVDCILNCDSNSGSFSAELPRSYLHLSVLTSKIDRFSLMRSLPSAVEFAKLNLSKEKKLLVCCHNGEDISVCVCLAILTSLYDETGTFDGGKTFACSSISKWDMRRRLVFICKYAINARPSRGNLKQVFGFLSKEKETLVAEESTCHDS